MFTPARAALLLGLSALAGCGPNYRYVYDGESAFERCYGLDYDATVADGARASCWSAWLQSYSYGANPDRVDFARNRLAAIGTPDHRPPTATSVRANPASLNPGATATPGAPTTALTVDVGRPAPAATATPAAPAASAWSGRMSTGGNPVNAPPPTHQDETGTQPPGASCAHDCRAAWSSASARCPRQDAACVARGDEGYRDCMRGCF
jgi:hypothetical protein